MYMYIYVGIFYIYIYIHKEIPYTEKSFIKGNPLYRDIPYVYLYLYIYIYKYTGKAIQRNPLQKETPYTETSLKGNPL